MKKILIISLMLVGAIVSNAKNYVCAGTEWITRFYVFSNELETYLQYCVLQESANPDVLGMELYISYENNSSEPALIAYIKNDGDKVWCMKPDMTEWYLMYDFGLQPGDTNTFYSVWSYNSGMVQSTMECLEIVENNPEFMGISSMKMVDEGHDTMYADNWLLGIGSMKGFIYNNWFGAVDGDIDHILVEVRHGGEIVYSNPAAIEEVNRYDSYTQSADPSTPVYDLTGRVVGKQADLNSLPSGIYISSGKKILK